MQIENDFEVKNHTAFKIGGNIKTVYFPETVDDIKLLPSDIYIIGNLSNTLISSFGVEKNVISTSKLDKIKIEGTKVSAMAGVKGPKLAQMAAEKGLSGLEFMIGFPGSVGGEVYMNASANAQCVSDCLQSVKVFDGKSIIDLRKCEMDFSYRHSICQDKSYMVLQAEFKLIQKNKEEVYEKMSNNLDFRKLHQPSLKLPNCGSIFKNPDNNSAGKLLDECGVKDLKIGGAKVWEGHANFIINDCDATSLDVLQLMCEMKKRVFEKFGIELVPEIKFLGGKNKEEVELCKYLKVK